MLLKKKKLKEKEKDNNITITRGYNQSYLHTYIKENNF